MLGLLWWTWAGYAWLTSVVDPEEGAVRLALLAAMAALLIAALTVPDSFGDMALEFALAYSYLHFPLVAGIVFAAFALHDTLAHAEDPLKTVPAFALLGGVAIYLLGHVAVRLRSARTLNRQRLALAVLLFALIPVARELPALATLGGVTVLLCAMIAYETRLYGERRGRTRHEYAVEGASSQYSPW